MRGCSGHQLQPCPKYKARWPRSGQDRVTSKVNQAETSWRICISASLLPLRVSVLFSLSPRLLLSLSLRLCLSAPPSAHLGGSLSVSVCVCVCVCFSKVFMICPFCPAHTLFRIEAPAAPHSKHLQHLSQHLHQARPSSSCVPLPPNLLYWESLFMYPSPLQSGAQVPPHRQPLGPLPAVQPGSP